MKKETDYKYLANRLVKDTRDVCFILFALAALMLIIFGWVFYKEYDQFNLNQVATGFFEFNKYKS